MNAVDAAQTRISEIENAIINGDKKLSANDLAAAKNQLDFAELQEAAKKHAEQKAIADTRRADLLNLQKTLAQIADSHPVIEKKFAAFEKNLNDYLSAVVVHQRDLRGVRDALQNGGFLVSTTPGPIEGIPTENARTVAIGEIAANDIQPQETIKLLTERLLGEFSQNLRA
jgi:hypothetical protein